MFFVVDPDVELLVDYFFARDDLLLTSAKLTEVLKTRKLKPREIYVVLTQTTKAVALCLMLHVSLYFPFLIAHSFFSSVYLLNTNHSEHYHFIH
jgi:hypothetical protein